MPSVFTASKYDQPLNEAPADVTVVTRAEILRYGWLTLADVLRGVRSFLVTNDRNYAYAGVRGFARTGDYNGRLLLLVDGHRTNDAIYDQALLGTEGPVDMDLVERVEIVRGAGSSLYGSNAFFGVINLITRRGRDIGGVEVSALAGTQSTYGGRITAGDRVGSQSEYLLSVNAGRTDGERSLTLPASSRTNAGVASDGDADWWVKSIAKWRTGDFSLSAVYDQRTKRVPTAPFNSVFDDNRNQTTDSRAWLEARYDGVVAGGNLTARAALDDYRYEGDLVQPFTPTTINQDRSKATWWSGEVTYARELAATSRWSPARKRSRTSATYRKTATASSTTDAMPPTPASSTPPTARATGRCTRRPSGRSRRDGTRRSACATTTTARSAASPIRGSRSSSGRTRTSR